ncbi:hypothetical protein FKW77_004561 [Venturia effusa]|uniref:BTB domain-containing protein n=1 Tax=Venturia effusa TaxID=50376 RepID=A0A517LLE1_9PEZI|nr:hypothetical protein FKW77_004561 [Venturia effusa]
MANFTKTDRHNIPFFSGGIRHTIVTVEIGPDKTPFTAHKDLLVACSPYFKAAFEGSFREASEKSVHIADVKPSTFQHFLDWLYFKKLGWCFPGRKAQEGERRCVICGGICQRWKTLSADGAEFQPYPVLSDEDDKILEQVIDSRSSGFASLYVFADRCNVPDLREAIINKEWIEFKGSGNLWRWSSLIYMLRNTSSSSPLRRLVVDECMDAKRWPDEFCMAETLLRQKLPHEFLLSMMWEKLTAPRSEPHVGPLCQYHEHAQDVDTIKACVEKAEATRKRKRDVSDVKDKILGEGENEE